MLSSFLVRSAVPADAPTLAVLRFEFRASQSAVVETAEHFIARCEPWMTERLAIGHPWRCWVAVDGNHLIGTAWLQIFEKLPNPSEERETHGYISSVYVQPSWRNLGVGSALLASCLVACDEADVDSVILWPRPASRALYQRHGFDGRDDLFERRR